MAPAGKKQNIVQAGDGGIGSTSLHAAAVDAHLKSKEGQAPKAEEITSLNKLLQWGASKSDKPSMAGARAPSQLDREWLDAMFPDMNAAVKGIIKALNGELDSDSNNSNSENEDAICGLLEALEEYMADLNYAQNIEGLQVLPPLFKAMEHASPRVNAGALWAIGSCLQDMGKNCELLAAKGGLPYLAKSLVSSERPTTSVKLKGIRAVSAFLRCTDTPPLLKLQLLRHHGAAQGLVACMGDDDPAVRARACFFVAHAATTGNAWIHEELLRSANGSIVVGKAVRGCDGADLSAAEAVAGAVNALLEHDKAQLKTTMPTMRKDLEDLRTRCQGISDESTASLISTCISKVS